MDHFLKNPFSKTDIKKKKENMHGPISIKKEKQIFFLESEAFPHVSCLYENQPMFLPPLTQNKDFRPRQLHW